MAQEVSTKNRITEGSIFGQLLLFFFPILFGTFFQQLYNTADAIVVGRFVGKEALAAVGGSTSVLINLLVGFFVGLSSGATVVISQYYGARKADKVHWAVHTSIAFSVMGGIIMMILGILGSYWALEAMKTPEDVMQPSMIYLRIYFIGTIPNLIYNMGAGILRAVGDSKRPLYFLIASCFVNIVLDVLLVAVLKIGVAGAAIATIASQLLSAVLVVWTLMKTEDTYKLEWKKVRIDQRMLRRIVRIGIPAGMQSIMYIQYLQYYHPGRREHTGNRQCNGMGHLRKGGRPVLDDDQCPWDCGHHLCGTELRCGPDRPCEERRRSLYGGGSGNDNHGRCRPVSLGPLSGTYVYNRSPGPGDQHPAAAFYGPHLYHIYCHRDTVRYAERRGRCMDAPDHHRCGDLRCTRALDHVCPAPFPQHHWRSLLLPPDLEPDQRMLYHLLLFFQLPGQVENKTFLEKAGTV